MIDVGIVFAARMVIRFASLAPEKLNLRQINKDLDALMDVLKTGASHITSWLIS